MTRKESYKAQRKNYRREKKRVASELFNSLQDPAIIVLADWLKVRSIVLAMKNQLVILPNIYLAQKGARNA